MRGGHIVEEVQVEPPFIDLGIPENYQSSYPLMVEFGRA
jgi:hypothetical protein